MPPDRPNLSSGRVLLSWLEPVAGHGHALRFATLGSPDADARSHRLTWSPARTVTKTSDLLVNWADFPAMSVLDNDHRAAHWLRRSDRHLVLAWTSPGPTPRVMTAAIDLGNAGVKP